jgi:hypothetical protein
MRVSDQYTAVILSLGTRLPAGILSAAPELGRVDIDTFANSRAETVVLSAYRHQEPLLAIRDRVQVLVGRGGTEFLVTCRIRTKRRIGSSHRGPVDVWVLPRAVWTGPIRSVVLPHERHMDLSTGRAILLTDSLDRPKWLEALSTTTRARPLRMNLVRQMPPPTGPGRSEAASTGDAARPRTGYDPIGAYTREVERSQTALALHRVNTLLEVVRTDPMARDAVGLHEVEQWLLAVRTELVTLRSGVASPLMHLVAGVPADGDMEGLRRLPIDRIARWLQHTQEDLAHAEAALVQHRAQSASSLYNHGLWLLAVQRVFDHAKSLTSLPRVTRPVALLGPTLSLLTVSTSERATHTMMTNMAGSLGMPAPTEATFVQFPDYLRHRAGALPLLARPAAQSLFEDNFSESPGQGYAFFALKRFVSQFMAKTFTGHDESRGNRIFPIREPEELRYLPPPLRRPLRFLLYDVMATLTMGPAYVYSLSRFCLGSLHEMFVHPLAYNPVDYTIYDLSIARRMGICLRCLEVMSIPFELSLSRFGVFPLRGNEFIDRAILDAPLRIYSLRDHARAVDDVQKALQAHRIIEAEPRLVLNALWDAVVRRKGYVNELATFLSLVAFPRGSFWATDLPGRPVAHKGSAR